MSPVDRSVVVPFFPASFELRHTLASELSGVRAWLPALVHSAGRLNADAVLGHREPEPDAALPDQTTPADRLITPAHAQFSDDKADLGVQTVELDRLAAGLHYLEGRE